ncbi:hypothetical protein BH10PSE11_BH10PSE11_35160 [soil metagenome]
MPGRRETARRATPDLIAFHRINAKRLRLEARRNTMHALFAWLARILTPR